MWSQTILNSSDRVADFFPSSFYYKKKQKNKKNFEPCFGVKSHAGLISYALEPRGPSQSERSGAGLGGELSWEQLSGPLTVYRKGFSPWVLRKPHMRLSQFILPASCITTDGRDSPVRRLSVFPSLCFCVQTRMRVFFEAAPR